VLLHNMSPSHRPPLVRCWGSHEALVAQNLLLLLLLTAAATAAALKAMCLAVLLMLTSPKLPHVDFENSCPSGSHSQPSLAIPVATTVGCTTSTADKHTQGHTPTRHAYMHARPHMQHVHTENYHTMQAHCSDATCSMEAVQMPHHASML
jgi:hypothetical protein